MKSAYELAMERLREQDPEAANEKPLTEAQKQALAEIDRKYQARLAERETLLDKALREAREKGDREAVAQIGEQRRHERLRLEEDREDEKNKIRRG